MWWSEFLLFLMRGEQLSSAERHLCSSLLKDSRFPFFLLQFQAFADWHVESSAYFTADNGTMHFWDWKTGYNFQRVQAAAQPGSIDSEAGIFALQFDKSGSRLITAEADKTIKIYKEDDTAVRILLFILRFIYLLAVRVVWAPRMTSQPVCSIFPWSLFSTALWDLANSRPVHSLMLSCHLFFRLLLSFGTFETVRLKKLKKK